jgi:tRNA(Arg) A34 adenosine deaminase TadA
MSQPEDLVPRLLEVIEQEILPLTRLRVAEGNKVCGAAILLKNDLSLVLADTNHELANPLFHGEVQAINHFYTREPSSRPRAADCVFLATHEPCPLCLSAIACAGFDNFFYLFEHADTQVRAVTRRSSGMLREVFGLNAVGYHCQNAFWHSYSLKQTVATMNTSQRSRLDARIERLQRLYSELSLASRASDSTRTEQRIAS